MRLRTRLALGFASLSLFAAGVLSTTALRAIRRSFDEQRDQAIANAKDTLTRNLRDATETLEGTLANVDELLAARGLARAAADGDVEAQGSLLDFLEEQRRQRRLDQLDLVRGSDGLVIGSAPWRNSSLSRSDLSVPRRAGQSGVVVLQTAAPDGAPLLPDGTPASRLGLAHTRALDSANDLFVVGAIFLDDPEHLRHLAGDPDAVSLTLEGRPPFEAVREGAAASGTPPENGVVATTAGALALVPNQDVVLEQSFPVLPSFDAPEAAGREAHLRVSRVDAAATLQARLFRRLLVVAFLLVCASIILASFLGQRFAAPIDALADGARAVAAGDLDYRVPSPSGARDEIGELVEAFNGMSRDLKDSRAKLLQTERIAAWREIAQRIAHEIKNPLTPIQLAVETTRRAHRDHRRDFDEIFEESAKAILEEVESLKRLVKEFSEFARMPEPVLAPDDVNEAVKHALEVVRPGLPEGVALGTDLADGLPRVALDREQLGRALLNLVANAADAVGGQGKIVVSTHAARDERGAAVEIHVVDDGPGVPAADREKIFTPYFTTKSTGTGLGLAIVQRIVTDHGGEITIREAQPKGADFVVRLRAAQEMRVRP